MTVSRIDCSADIQLDLLANVPLFVYLAMSNRPALVHMNKSAMQYIGMIGVISAGVLAIATSQFP